MVQRKANHSLSNLKQWQLEQPETEPDSHDSSPLAVHTSRSPFPIRFYDNDNRHIVVVSLASWLIQVALNGGES